MKLFQVIIVLLWLGCLGLGWISMAALAQEKVIIDSDTGFELPQSPAPEGAKKVKVAYGIEADKFDELFAEVLSKTAHEE